MDLELISGDFFYEDSIPKNQAYLLKYFTTEIQRQFLLYYLAFRELRTIHGPFCFYRNFIDHTGMRCTNRVMQRWIRRIRELESTLVLALEQFDLEAVEIVRTGLYRF